LSYRPCPCAGRVDCDGAARRREHNGEITVHPYEFSLADIVPCRAQVMWLVQGDCEFVEDRGPGSHRVMPHAAFTLESELHAEMEYRLARTGALGRALEWTVRVNGVRVYRDLAPELRGVVDYVAGRKRKKQTFAQWQADRVRRRRDSTRSSRDTELPRP
jgi:hypothetical protein